MKRNIYLGVFILISALFYPLLLWSRGYELRSVSTVIIPIFVILQLLNVLVLYAVKPEKKYILFILAFFFIVIGDLTINLTPYKLYAPMPFVVAHILLIVFFIYECRFKKNNFKTAIPVALAFLGIVLANLPFVESWSVFLGLSCYLLFLSIMAWRALCYLNHPQISTLKRSLIVAGGVLFFLTDIFTGCRYLYGHQFWLVLTWIVYPPCLLFLGLANWFDTENK